VQTVHRLGSRCGFHHFVVLQQFLSGFHYVIVIVRESDCMFLIHMLSASFHRLVLMHSVHQFRLFAETEQNTAVEGKFGMEGRRHAVQI
jgi:hypothetical protein